MRPLKKSKKYKKLLKKATKNVLIILCCDKIKANSDVEVLHMRITNLRIKNFKPIRNMYIKEIENALILVGKNNTGKTAVLAGFAGAKIAENSDKNDNE